jgi:hypothetical protein
MKVCIFSFLLLLGVSASASAQHDTDTVLVGPLTIENLLDLHGWFGEDFISYLPDPKYAGPLPEYLEDVEIICVLGTWCSDSRREVPRMLRIMQYKSIAPEKLRMIGVDREKLSPGGEAARYNIERVPTFVFLRDGVEIGRIVEAPLATLEKDMLGIVITAKEEAEE